MSADGVETLSPAAQACRLMADFLFAAAADVRKHCDESDADLLDTAARDCADTVEWEFDMLQMATRALKRSTDHPGWFALCADGEGDAKPIDAAIRLYADVAKRAWVEFSHAQCDLPDSELDRMKAAAHAHDMRVGMLMEIRDLWFEPVAEEACA